jgi:ribosomal protein S8|mmetsp:Transcript_35589/g.46831  ORF Transcript_35589/g.46831 Transcript_35589/m.46831 type:complete len:81 (+) Transcript_35589:719-961(+)
MKRYNDDVADGVAHLRAVYQSLSSATANCSSKTQKEIASVVERLDQIKDEASLMSNMAENKNHVELTLAKMKMTAVIHDY